MNYLTKLISSRSQKGQTLVEYGLILALVSIILITVLSLLSNQLNNTFNTIIDTLDAISS